MIQSLKAEGLYGQFNFDLEFKEDLNIFTGGNGCGKTTLLKLIWYLISGNLHRVPHEIPFKSVSIETDQFNLSLKQDKPKPLPPLELERSTVQVLREGSIEPKISIDWWNGKNKETYEVNVDGFHTKAPVKSINDKMLSLGQKSIFFSTFRRIEGGFLNDFSNADRVEKTTGATQNSTGEMLKTTMSRLSGELSTNGHQFITAVSTNDIEKFLPLKKNEVAAKVNELYEELSNRLSYEVISPDILKSGGEQALSALENIKTNLIKTGETRQKLENRMTVLDETTQVVLEYEEIQIANGVTLGKKKEKWNKKPAIQADKLSSGEKQMLGYLCYNAFSDNTVIFIDEPELSLHQDWQDILFPLLLKQETGNQFFVATHSEFIYNQFPDKEHILNLEGN